MELKTPIKLLTILCLSLTLASCGSGDSDSRISLGLSGTIITQNELQYHQPVVVQVTDITGAPKANTNVTFSLKTISFFKGTHTFTNDTDGDGTVDQWATNVSVTCTAEDINNNGVLDAGEDTNGNGLLEPDSPSISSHPSELPTLLSATSTLVTDDNGFGFITLVYPRSEAHWVRVQLTATTQDGLVENTGVETITLPILIDDINDSENDPPGGTISQYGSSASCSDTL